MRLFELFGSIFIDDKKALNQLQNVDKKGASVGATFGKMGKQAISWGKSLLAATGLALSVGGVVSLSKKFIEMSDNLVDTSKKTGLTISQLQELKYVSEQTGASFDTVSTATARLKASMLDASNGSKEQKEAFEKLRVSVYNVNGGLKSVSEFMPEVLTALSEMTNETERDARAMDIFGRSAQELAPLMQQGADSVDVLVKKFHELGLEIDENAIRMADKVADDMATLRQSFNVIGGDITGEFLPAIQDFVKLLQDNMPAIINFVQEFTDTVKGSILFIQDLANGVGILIDKFGFLEAKATKDLEKLKDEEIGFAQKSYDYKIKLIDEEIKAKNDSLTKIYRDLEEETKKEKDLADDKEKALRDNLDDRIDAEQKAHDKRIKFLDKEYEHTVDILDAETDARVKALQDQIDALDESEQRQEIADLKQKISTTQNMGHKKEYLKELAELEKEKYKDDLRKQIDAIKDEAAAKKQQLRKEYENKKEAENNKYAAAQESFDKERKALEGYAERYKKNLDEQLAAKKKAEGSKLQSAIDNMKAEKDAAKKHLDALTDNITKSYQKQIEASKSYYDYIELKAKEKELLDLIGRPGQNVSALYQALDKIRKQIKEMESDVKGNLVVPATAGAKVGKRLGFAEGTDFVPQTGRYLVGERGPEEVLLPQGSRVKSNDELTGDTFIIEKGALSGAIILDDYGVDKLFERMAGLWKRRGIRPQWR